MASSNWTHIVNGLDAVLRMCALLLRIDERPLRVHAQYAGAAFDVLRHARQYAVVAVRR